MSKKDKWIRRWKIRNSKDTGDWTVAIDEDGNYGCSCPVWKFKRKECKHIRFVKENPDFESDVPVEKLPKVILANVLRPEFDKDKNEIYCPLVTFDDRGTWMEATICWFLMEHGFSWRQVKERRKLPKEWTKSAVLAYIETNGLAEYVDYLGKGNGDLRRQKVKV